jgi:hypothetical protein
MNRMLTKMAAMMWVLAVGPVAGTAWAQPLANTDFSKGDFAALGWQVEGAWDIFDYKAAANNPGPVARMAARSGAGKLTKTFDAVKNPKNLTLSLDIGWGWGAADKGDDCSEFMLLDARGDGYIFHIQRWKAKWAVQWAPVEEYEAPKNKRWAATDIDCTRKAVRDGGGMMRIVVTRDADANWTIGSKDWNDGAGGEVKFTDATTVRFSQLVLMGIENVDENLFNNVVLEVTR